jgi:hypothetical protein
MHASRADIRMDGQVGARVFFGFAHRQEEAAIGFSVTCDALRFRLRLPREICARESATAGAMWRALRTARFFDLAQWGRRLVSSRTRSHVGGWPRFISRRSRSMRSRAMCRSRRRMRQWRREHPRCRSRMSCERYFSRRPTTTLSVKSRDPGNRPSQAGTGCLHQAE